MTDRYLTITMQADWQGALRAAGRAAKAGSYQGEVLNFESPGDFFGQLSRPASVRNTGRRRRLMPPPVAPE